MRGIPHSKDTIAHISQLWSHHITSHYIPFNPNPPRPVFLWP
jgi:hypothetical protein